jgi:hypothetical protein
LAGRGSACIGVVTTTCCQCRRENEAAGGGNKEFARFIIEHRNSQYELTNKLRIEAIKAIAIQSLIKRANII